MKSIKIGHLEIGKAKPPLIIAEMSGNHNHSLQRALSIVEAAAKAGVHALKLQTYTADTMTIDVDRPEFEINDPKSLWNKRKLFDLYKEAHTPWEWHQPIFKRCSELGLVAFSTPFDLTAVAFLEKLKVPCYKIASFELVDMPLIKKVAATGKPIIMSTGMATIKEIKEAIAAAKKAGGKDIILLKCTSSYPASPQNSNLMTLPDMAKKFRCQVGVSDHTLGSGAALAGVALGATVIEKHFTLSRSDGGVDSAFSMEPDEMKNLVDEANKAWQALGKVAYGPTQQDKSSLIFRRSLYVVRDMKADEKLSPANMRVIRPGHGLPPKYYKEMIGRRAKRPIKAGTALKRELFK